MVLLFLNFGPTCLLNVSALPTFDADAERRRLDSYSAFAAFADHSQFVRLCGQFIQHGFRNARNADVLGRQLCQQRFAKLRDVGNSIGQVAHAILEDIASQPTIPKMSIALSVQVIKRN